MFWKRIKRRGRDEEREESEQCLYTLYTHYTVMTYFHPSIYPSISYSTHHQWMDYTTGAKTKKETYLPGFCFIRILNKNTHIHSLAHTFLQWKTLKSCTFLFDLCTHIKKEETQQNAWTTRHCIYMHYGLHFVEHKVSESGGNGHHFKRNKRIQITYIFGFRLGCS